MANYYLGDDGSISKNKKKKGNQYKLQDDGTIKQINIPSTTTKQQQTNNTGGFLKGGSSNLLEGLWNTYWDLSFDVGKGALNTLEGLADFSQYLTADLDKYVAGELDKRLYALSLGNIKSNFASDLLRQYAGGLEENAKFNSTASLLGENENAQDTIFGNQWRKDVKEKSYSGEMGSSVAQGVGNIAAMAAIGAVTGGVANMAGFTGAGGAGLSTTGKVLSSGIPSFTSAYGNSMSEALNNGASEKDAHVTATINGLAEAISEQFFEGMPGLKSAGWGDKLTGKLADKLTGALGSNVGKVFLKLTDGLGEGAEEIISNVLVALGNDFVHLVDKDFDYGMENQTGNALEDIVSAATSEDSIKSFISAGITSALLGGGQTILNKQQTNQVISAYAKDNNMSFKEAKALLMGENLETSKQQAIEEGTDYDSQIELGEQAENRILRFMQQNTGRNVENYISDLVKLEADKQGITYNEKQIEEASNRIRNNLIEQTNNPAKYTEFTQETDNESDAKLVQSFKDAKLNNTEKVHNVYDFVKSLKSKNENIDYEITSNEKLAEMGILEKQEQDGKTKYLKNGKEVAINGFIKDGKVYINADGKNAVQNTAYHELGHSIKESNPELYNEMKDLVYQIAGKEGLQEYRELYDVKDGELSSELTDNVEDEYVNDKLGELLNNEKFLNKLNDNRTLLQKIIDKLKEIITNITSSGDKKTLIEAQQRLEDLYLKGLEETEGKIETKESQEELPFYSLSQSEELNNYIENNNYKLDTNGSLEVNNLTDKQVKDLTKAYNKNGFTDVTEEFVRNRLSQGFKIPRAVADTYLQTELGGKPQIDTTQVFEDADGNQLTQEQVDFFKDSDVRDIRGRLIPVYHTTDADFTIFNPKAQTKNGKKYGKGLYFSETPENYGNKEMKLYLNAKEGEYKYIQDKGYYIVQEPNMVKNVGNTNPTSNPDIRYSLSVQEANTGLDSDGEQLTKGQQEYFANSKVTDSKGNLQVVYHGTQNYDFNEFEGGVFLTDDYMNADGYAFGERVIAAYANIENPLVLDCEGRKWDKLDTPYGTSTREIVANFDRNKYDGVIFENINDNWIDDEDAGYPGNVYYVDNSNQVKNIDNENPTTNADIRYSLSPSGEMIDNQTGEKVTFDVEQDKDLMAIHNLNEDKLNGVLDLGGFPYPSIAITRPSTISHEGYGDISVIFKPDAINPELNKKNKVYSRDAYTPRFPTLEYKVSSNEVKNIRNVIGDYDYRNAKPGDDYISRAYSIMDNLEDNINRSGLEKTLDDIKNSPAMKYVYLKDTNQPFDVVTRNEQYSSKYDNDTLQRFLDNYDGEYELNDLPSSEYDKYANTMWEAYREQLINKYKESNFDEDTSNKLLEHAKENFIKSFAERNNFAMAAYKLQKYGQDKQVLDSQTTEEKLNSVVNQEEYEKWVDNLFKNIIEKKGLRNNKDYYTASGNPRTFEQLHDEYTLENVVKILDSLNDTGEESGFFYGISEIAGNASVRFNTMEDIRANKNLLETMGNEEYQQLLEDISDRLGTIQEAIMERGQQNSDNYFIARDNMSSAIADAARIYGEGKKIDATKVQKMLKEYGFDANIEESQQILDMFSETRELPTQYFESKPQRAVGFDEIGTILIPNTLSEDTKQRLIDNNISYEEYNPEIEGDRLRAVNEYEQYKFSLSNQEQENQNQLEKIKQVSENLPMVEEYNLPLTEEEQLSEMEEKRRKLADKRFEKMIEKQTYKSLNSASKEAGKYIDFNRAEMNEFRDSMAKLAKLPKDSLIKAKNYNQVKDAVSKYANRDMTFINEEMKEAQKDVKKAQIIVSDDLKNQITDWGDFRKYSRLNIKKGQNSNIDSVYQELAESYPGMIDESIINPADQLIALSEFAKRDTKYVEHYQLSDNTINQITNRVWEKLSQNALTKQEINDIQDDINKRLERRTREVVQNDLLEQMGITLDDIQEGNDINSIAIQRTDPKRLNEKVFGYNVGKKINDATVNFVNHQEAERTRFLNKEREEIKDLGIKPRSKESAAVQKYGEKQYVNDKGEVVKYTEQDLMNEFPNRDTQEKIKKAARVLREKYDRYIDQENEVLTEMGYDPIPKRQDYFRHFIELEDKLSQWGIPYSRQNLMAEDLSTDINGLTDQFKPGKNFFASALERKGMKTTYDAITGIDQYLEGASNLIYQTESIQRYRTLSKFIRETFGQKHGLDDVDLMTDEQREQRIQDVYNNKLTRYAAWLDEQANSLAGKKGAIDRAAERFMGRRIYTALNALKSQVGSNMTGFNVRSSMTNFASAIQGASKTNKIAFLEGTMSTLRNIIQDDGLIDKSDFLTNRFGSDTLSKKAWQKISNAGQIFMTGTDYFTANQIWRGKYYEGLNKGLTEDAAIKQADDFAARIMGDRSKGQTAEIFNSKTLGLLTQFQLEVNNQWSSMIHDNKMEFEKDGGIKTAAKVTFQLGQLYAMSYMFNGLMKALTGSDVMFDPIEILKGIFAPPDDDDDEEVNYEERATEAIGKIIDQLPMASIFTGGRIPLSEAFTGVGTLAKKLTNQKDQWGNEYSWEDVKDDLIASAFYYLLPTGYGQIKKTAQGLGQYGQILPEPIEQALDIYHNENLPLAGNYTKTGRLKYEADTSTEGKVQSALFGRNASANAQEYREKGYQPLTEKKVNEALSANLPISEYREIDSDIANAKKLAKEKGESQQEAQYDYIYNLPLSMEQKNSLLNARLGTGDEVTDDNGYVKYTDGSKTYWYDEKNDVVYNSKYRAMSNIDVDDLTKYSNKKDLTNYGDYESLDEFNYATKNPLKYKMLKQISTYSKYNEYKDDIAAIKDNYNDGTTSGKNAAYKSVYNYIEALPLNQNQKLMLLKMAGGYSIKSYKKQMRNYIESLSMSADDKQAIYNELF